MAKSKSARSSTASLEKAPTNQVIQQWRSIRSEVGKVTWPTREEAQKLTIAVTIGMIVMALFLYTIDAFFQIVVSGILSFNIVWIIVGIIIVALIGLAFFRNSQEE